MSFLRNVLDAILVHYYESELFLKQIKEYSYVSFDIFDTLIVRNVEKPEDVFDLVELKANHKWPEWNIRNFRKIRIDAEREARRECVLGEITLHDIYTRMADYSQNQKEKLEFLEVSIEKDVILKNEKLWRIYEYCKKEGKHVIITSDMYLSKEVILSILKKSGVTQYEKIYLSSEIKKKKSTGGLYQYILEDLNISPGELCHIGDNFGSDYKMAKRNNIKAFLWYKKKQSCAAYWKCMGNDYALERVLQSFVNCGREKIGTPFEKLGFDVMGILLYGFCVWLNDKVKNHQRICFLARDAHIIQKAYLYLYPEDEEKVSYLHLSRKSVKKPYLSICEKAEEVWSLYSGLENRVAYDDIFKDLDFESYIPQNEREIFKKPACYSEFTSGIVKERLEVAVKQAQEQNKKQRELFLEYLEQEGICGKAAFVDVGWKGTIPYCVSKLLGKADVVDSFFLGCEALSDRQSEQRIEAYLFSPKGTEKPENFLTLLFELFFLEVEGSTTGYMRENDFISPIIIENENKSATEQIEGIHKGALRFVRELNECFGGTKIPVTNHCAMLPFLNFMKHPRIEDVEIFRDMDYFSFNARKVCIQHNRIFYLLHPVKLIKEYRNSIWKVGFLKEFFRVPLPYNFLYKISKKLGRECVGL